MLNNTILSDSEPDHADHREKSRQFIQNAIELALSFGDFQKEVHCQCTPLDIVLKTAERISRLISFEASALYLVDEETSDMQLSVCRPADYKKAMEDELNFLIENGFVAWAIRERRGIIVYSKDGHQQILLHVISTYSRTRGLFMGLFPTQMRRLPDASLEILSIILRNAANGIESLTYSNMLRQQKMELEKIVAEKTQRLVHYEKQLLQAQNMEAIAALAGGVAHQFNNALTGLIGYLDLISLCVGGDSDAAGYLERIRPVTDRMTSLTNHLLAYAQGGKYMASIVSLRNLLADVQPVIRRSIKSCVQLTTESADDTLTVQVDMIQLRMAILAIANNADEAIAQEGNIHICGHGVSSADLDEEIRTELRPGEYVCLSIRDTGRGMDKNTRRRIFQPFFSTKFEGRGLSMAAVFGIIKNHNGWITVDSELDLGTTVNIYLPIVAPKPGNEKSGPGSCG
jgi:signal transduction histidine kinase